MQHATQLRVYCGSHCILWNDLTTILDVANNYLGCKYPRKENLLLDIAHSLVSRLPDLSPMASNVKHTATHSPGSILKELIHNSAESQCSDPGDIVYTLLGLAKDCQPDDIPIDYHSQSALRLYRDVMKLYTTHRDAGGWSSRSGRDAVQFSYFLQKNLGLTSTTSLQVPIEDSEPVFIFGFSAGKIGTILPEPARCELQTFSPYPRHVYDIEVPIVSVVRPWTRTTRFLGLTI